MMMLMMMALQEQVCPNGYTTLRAKIIIARTRLCAAALHRWPHQLLSVPASLPQHINLLISCVARTHLLHARHAHPCDR